MSETVLDVRGLACPMPILKTKQALAGVASGALLRIRATDRGTPKDFAEFCRKTGHELLESAETDGEFTFLIRRR